MLSRMPAGNISYLSGTFMKFNNTKHSPEYNLFRRLLFCKTFFMTLLQEWKKELEVLIW